MIRDLSISDVWLLLGALRWTIALSAIAFLGGGIIGLVVTLARTSENRFLEIVSSGYIGLFQGTPLLMQLFLVFFGASVLGFDVDAWSAAAIGLSLHASAFLGEIWRGCVQAVPRGQTEAAIALSLGYLSRMIHVVLPQAAKICVAPTVGFLVQLIKGTSLASIIGFVELTRAGQLVNTATFQPLAVFALVGAGYFLICWPLSLLATQLEERLSAGSSRTSH
jgi:polar amino acid transport system permease protein